jgi:hypothetical protein
MISIHVRPELTGETGTTGFTRNNPSPTSRRELQGERYSVSYPCNAILRGGSEPKTNSADGHGGLTPNRSPGIQLATSIPARSLKQPR